MNKMLKYAIFAIFIICILAMISFWIIKSNDQKLRDILLENASIASASIDINELKSLTANQSDLQSQIYQDLKKQLFNIRTSNDSYKFLYLLGMKKNNKTVFFFIDSQIPESPDYAPPGEIYSEVSDEYINAFKTKKQMTVGPVTDRWGTMITALIPILDDKNGELIAILGLDIIDDKWQETIYVQSFPIIGFIAFVILTSIVLSLIKRNFIKSIKESKEKFAKAFHSNPAVIGLSDLETGEYIEVNQSFYDTLGFEPGEVIGKKASDLVKLDKEFRDEIIAELKKNGSIYNKEGIIYAKDGRRVDVLLSAEVIQIQDKKYNLTSTLDITDRKQAEEELAAEKERLAVTLRSIGDGVITTDIEGKIVIINKVAEDLTGWSNEDARGKLAHEVFSIVNEKT
ncbi:MAG: PAS domain S-box protein, partial [Thermodesulfobacteriota bacterium]|nr:PAS domain S-box protein [Thermodesulfobacteriota bacterium]